jgi:O-antigen ligase
MVFVLLIWQWGIRHLIDNNDRLHAIITAYIFGCVASAFVAIVQLEAHQLISLGTLYKGRSTGLAKHPDDTGSLLALGLAFSVGLALYRQRAHRWIYVVSAIVIGVGLICTGSVSGMITALLGAIIAMALGGVRAKQVLTIVAVVAIAYVAGTAVQGASGKSLNPIQRFTAATGSQSGGSNSVGPRIGTWRGAFHGIVNSPFLGHGLDLYSGVTYTDPNNNTPEETHDFVLMGWYQGGALFFVGELICIAEGLRRMFLRGKRDPYRPVLVAGGVTVIAFALQAPMLFDRYFWLPFVLATTYPMLKGGTNGGGDSNGNSVGLAVPVHAEFSS